MHEIHTHCTTYDADLYTKFQIILIGCWVNYVEVRLTLENLIEDF